MKKDHSFKNLALKMQIYQTIEWLIQQRHNIFIKQIFIYNKIKKNERADKAAKKEASQKKIKTARQSSLAYIKPQIIKEKKLSVST